MLKNVAGWRFFEAPYHPPKPTHFKGYTHEAKNLWGGSDFTLKIQRKANIVNGKKYGRKENNKTVNYKIKNQKDTEGSGRLYTVYGFYD